MNERKPLDPSRALERMAAQCAKTEYCEQDVRRKLRTWLVDSEYFDEIVSALRDGKFIDDARYCHAFTEDKWRFNRWGRIKIRMELRQRRMPQEEIDAALAGIDEEEYLAGLSELLRQKRTTLRDTDDYTIFRKLVAFAASRGFEPEVIRECLEGDID